jgi:hypothetical protein
MKMRQRRLGAARWAKRTTDARSAHKSFSFGPDGCNCEDLLYLPASRSFLAAFGIQYSTDAYD